MIEYLNLFLNNLLPIFLAAGAGYLLAKWLPINPRTLSSTIFYIFSPCLVFTLLTHTQLSVNDVFSMVVFTVLVIGGVGIITWLIGRSLRLQRDLLAGVLITSMFINAGNYGLPVNLFAFGEAAAAYAAVFFVTNVIMTNTVGVLIASLGKTGLKNALFNLFKLPAVYAVVLAIVFIQTGWQVPLPIERTVKILGDASIPAMLILLGVQFHAIRIKGKIVPLTMVSVMRLLTSPALALGLAALFGFSGAARQAAVLEAAMPTAVLNTALAIQFDTDPSFVAAAITTTTLLSPFTLTPLIAYLGG